MKNVTVDPVPDARCTELGRPNPASEPRPESRVEAAVEVPEPGWGCGSRTCRRHRRCRNRRSIFGDPPDLVPQILSPGYDTEAHTRRYMHRCPGNPIVQSGFRGWNISTVRSVRGSVHGCACVEPSRPRGSTALALRQTHSIRVYASMSGDSASGARSGSRRPAGAI